MKRRFNLESAEFSSDSESEIKMPSSRALDLYNRQYSLVLNEAKDFFSECKQSLNRFLSMNQYGLGFNIPLIWTSFLKMQHQLNNHSQIPLNKRSSEWNKKRPRYEGIFHKILEKMNEVITDLIGIEVEIKEAYLHQKVDNLNRVLTQRTMKKQILRGSQGSIEGSLSNKSIKRILLHQQLQDQLEAEEQKMRKLLSEKMLGESFQISADRVCKQEQCLQKNIGNLAQKMDKIFGAITKIKTQESATLQLHSTQKQLNLAQKASLQNHPQHSLAQKRKQSSDIRTIKNIRQKLKLHHIQLNSLH